MVIRYAFPRGSVGTRLTLLNAGMWMTRNIGVIPVPGIMQGWLGCWGFVQYGNPVCIPTRERGNESRGKR